jgi:hypothetical protein
MLWAIRRCATPQRLRRNLRLLLHPLFNLARTFAFTTDGARFRVLSGENARPTPQLPMYRL